MKSIQSILFIFIFFLQFSCSKDKLNPVPQTLLAEENAFSTKDRIISQVNGLYAAVKDGNYLGGRYLIYNDIRGANFLNNASNSVTGYLTWGHNLNGETNEVANLWSTVYLAINKINIFLEGLEAVHNDPVKSSLITDAEYGQYKGEALTLRALGYFHLLQLYAQPFNKNNGASDGLPLRLKANKLATDNDLARSSVAVVYTQILNDLDTAEPLVLLNNGSDQLNVTRVHRNTVIALKTRVYLHISNYAKVIEEAQKIVPASAPYIASSGVANALQANIKDVFTAPYQTKESIFSLPFTSTDLPGTQNALAYYYVPAPAGNGEYSLNPAGILGNVKWSANDSRRSFVLVKSSKNYLNKYPVGPLNTDNVPVIRYAEVLLNYAEASVRNDGISLSAVNLLNAVRGRSYPAGTYQVSDFASPTDLINAILLERNIEFLGEGLENSDILRTLSTIPGKVNINAIPLTAKEYIWPIPIQEILINKLITPN